MKFILLHGAPAVGKLTIAKELSRITGAVLFHNHLTINVAKPIFEFGTEPFWELVTKLRFESFEAAAKNNIEKFIFTYCYSHPKDLHEVEAIENILNKFNGELCPVFLHSDLSITENRIANDDRKHIGKLTSIEAFYKLVKETNYAPIPRTGCLAIDTGVTSPELAAQKVIAYFNL